MTTVVATRGRDTYVRETTPSRNFGDAAYPVLRAGAGQGRRIFVTLSPGEIKGRTVLSATLAMKLNLAATAQTYTLQRVAASWAVGRMTWDNQPGVTGATVAVSPGALAAGAVVTFDVTALVQQVANGSPHYGWRIITDSTTGTKVYGFDSSAETPWVLTVELSDAPNAPTVLTPAGGAVSLSKWTQRFDFTDLGGDVDLAAAQIRIDPDQTTPFVFDTGEVATTVPEVDLAGTFPRTATITRTNLSTTITAATATFEAADIGATIVATGIPAGATITAVASPTSATISANATLTGSVSATITRSYAGLADAATTSLQVRVKDTAGIWSDWSDWVQVTRQSKPTLTMTNPSTSVLWDPTPTITGSITSGVVKDFRVTVTKADNPADVRYDSGRIPQGSGTTIAHTIPMRHQGRVVFLDDTAYVVTLRVHDRTDRQSGGPTDPPYLEVSRTATFSQDGTVAAPSTLTTAARATGLPGAKLTWTRGSAPDRFIVFRDGERIDEVDAVDALVSAGTWSYSDKSARPNHTSTYKVRAVTVVSGVDHESNASPTATWLNPVEGLWLISDAGSVMLDGDGIDGIARADRRATYSLPYRRDDVDIIGAFEGLSGPFDGVLSGDEATVDAGVVILRAIRRDPATPVQLVYGTISVPVLLRNLSVTPTTDVNPKYGQFDQRVTFGCWQVGDFDTVV